MTRLAFVIALATLAGCATSDDGRFRAPKHATWGDAEDGSAIEASPELSRTLFEGPDGAYEAIREGDHIIVPQAPIARAPNTPAPATRPPAVGPRTVKLRGAPLDSALRMLAEAGQFNLLLEGELRDPVSGDLKNVDPFEALVALARAHGASVSFDGQIVVVTSRSKAAPPPAP